MNVVTFSALFDASFYKKHSGRFEENAQELFWHYCLIGERAGLQPNPLFDPIFYANEAKIPLSEQCALIHYACQGWKEGFRTHHLFDSRYYIENNPDVIGAGCNPLGHFLVSGGKEGRKPHPLFESWFYMSENTERLNKGENPLVHYLQVGWRNGRNPHPLFDNDFYLLSHPILRSGNLSPLEHYVLEGAAVGDLPNPFFDNNIFKERQNDKLRLLTDDNFVAASTSITDSDIYEALSTAIKAKREVFWKSNLPKSDVDVKKIAFYLPQFHPIKENDLNWGKGFTEWDNVRKAEPNFPFHDQPRIPDELGYYDLRDPAVMKEQAALAKQYGVFGFCMYWYWFDGYNPLHLPLERMLESRSPDFPFCLCWANENWTRRWAGEQSSIIGHTYTDDDQIRHAETLSRYMKDDRYIKVNGSPLLLIYRAKYLPDTSNYIQRWRKIFAQLDIPALHFALVESAELAWAGVDPRSFGFDSSVEFPPHGGSGALKSVPGLDSTQFHGAVFDYRQTVMRYATSALPPYPCWRSVMGAWDNTARYQNKSAIFINAHPRSYQAWLEAAMKDVIATAPDGDRFVFINAWNEWGEGTYLEPDKKWGRQYLEATRDAHRNVHAHIAIHDDETT